MKLKRSLTSQPIPKNAKTHKESGEQLEGLEKTQTTTEIKMSVSLKKITFTRLKERDLIYLPSRKILARVCKKDEKRLYVEFLTGDYEPNEVRAHMFSIKKKQVISLWKFVTIK